MRPSSTLVSATLPQHLSPSIGTSTSKLSSKTKSLVKSPKCEGVDIENPVLEVIPAPLSEHSVVPGSKEVLFCEQARVSGVSDGCLNTVKRIVKFPCPADVIPPYIDVDLSELDVNQKIVIGDLKVHPDLKLLQSKDEPVCNITGARVSEQKKCIDKDST